MYFEINSFTFVCNCKILITGFTGQSKVIFVIKLILETIEVKIRIIKQIYQKKVLCLGCKSTLEAFKTISLFHLQIYARFSSFLRNSFYICYSFIYTYIHSTSFVYCICRYISLTDESSIMILFLIRVRSVTFIFYFGFSQVPIGLTTLSWYHWCNLTLSN